MLAVRRVGVTQAASELQRAHYIKYRSGELTVRDRAGLVAAACSCYAADRALADCHKRTPSLPLDTKLPEYDDAD